MKVFTRTNLLFVILISTVQLEIYAQKLPCNLRLNVSTFDAQRNSVEVIGASVRLYGRNKKPVIQVMTAEKADVEGLNLLSGKYKLSVSKSDFLTREKQIEIDCTLADESGFVLENIYLWKEKKKLKAKSGDGFTIAASDNNKVKDEKGLGDVKPGTNKSVTASPKYPEAARAQKIYGKVVINVTIDEDGNVIKAIGVSGYPLLQKEAIKAARRSKFTPTTLEDVPVKVQGDIVYNFTP